MEHVRLPLTSKNYIIQNVVREPLLNNCPKCMFCFKYVSIHCKLIYIFMFIYFMKVKIT